MEIKPERNLYKNHNLNCTQDSRMFDLTTSTHVLADMNDHTNIKSRTDTKFEISSEQYSDKFQFLCLDIKFRN